MSTRIGAACAHQLAQNGVHLALTYSTNLGAMNELVVDLQSKYAENKLRISIHQVDVGLRTRSRPCSRKSTPSTASGQIF